MANTFEHRHYKAIAAIIADMPDAGYREDIALHFRDALKGSNPNYNAARFFEAAMGTPSNGRDKVR